MTWQINFCAPFLPNDSTINFHRFFQGILLAGYSLAYLILHIYYLYWGPLPLSNEKEEPQADLNKESDDLNSDGFSSQSNNKEVSIKLEEQANESCVELKKTAGSTWNQSNSSGGQQQAKIVENVTVNELQQYYPLVYGHFALAMAFSLMYTPYAQQSIGGLLYTILTIPLLIANAKRMHKTAKFFWILMGLILLFFFICVLLEVGQSNWDVINNDCFANRYISIYE